jgi:hypothetical protein
MDFITTKLAGCSIVVILYILAIRRPAVSTAQLVLGSLYFSLCGRLGFDTLAYKWLIEEQRLGRFGWLWEYIGNLYELTQMWWSIHLLVYTILVTSFYRLSAISSYPSLAFAMLMSLPGVGFSYLSIMRQALAMGLATHGFLEFRKRSWFAGVVLMLSAVLSHSSCFPWVVGFAIVSLPKNYKKYFQIGVIVGLGLLLSALILLVEPIFENLRFQILIEGYVSDQRTIESGFWLTAFWIVLGAISILLKHINGSEIANRLITLRIICICGMYAFAFIRYGELVRLVWYGLPLLVCDIVGCFKLDQKTGVSNIIRLTTTSSVCLLSMYPLYVAPDHYWQNQYPFYWNLID